MIHFLLPGTLIACLIAAEEAGTVGLPGFGRISSWADWLFRSASVRCCRLRCFLSHSCGLVHLGQFLGWPCRESVQAPGLCCMATSLIGAHGSGAMFSISRLLANSAREPPTGCSSLDPGTRPYVLPNQGRDTLEYQMAWQSFYCAPPIVIAIGVLLCFERPTVVRWPACSASEPCWS